VNRTLRTYFVLPCCLLLLNLVNSIISYKAQLIRDGILRTGFVIAMVLFGSSVVAFLVTPGIEGGLRLLHRTGRKRAGIWGEVGVVGVIGLIVFWLYFRANTLGTASILLSEWRNHR
jgi:hypothetical protein